MTWGGGFGGKLTPGLCSSLRRAGFERRRALRRGERPSSHRSRARSLNGALLTAAVALTVLPVLAACFLHSGAAMVSAQAANDVAALMERAEAAFAAKRTVADGLEVKALYEAVLEADPDHVPAMIRLAELAYWLGQVVEDGPALPHLEAGLTHAERAAELDGENPEAHFWQGVLMGRIGEERGVLQSLFMVDDIMRAVERTLELDPNHSGAHLLASQVYRKAPGWPLSIGNREKALEHALEAVRLEPDATDRMLNLAEAYLANRRRDEAVEALRKVLEMPLTPGDEVTSQKDKERAAELLEELTQ